MLYSETINANKRSPRCPGPIVRQFTVNMILTIDVYHILVFIGAKLIHPHRLDGATPTSLSNMVIRYTSVVTADLDDWISFNSLAPGTCGKSLKSVISDYTCMFVSISRESFLRWMPQGTFGHK